MRASRQTRRALPMRDTWPQQGRPIVSVSTILKSRSIIYAARFLSRARFPARSTLRHTSSLDDLRTLVDDKPLPSPPPCPRPSVPLQKRVLNDVATGVLVDFCIVLLSRVVVWNFENFDTVSVYICMYIYNWTELKYCGYDADFAFPVIESRDH